MSAAHAGSYPFPAVCPTVFSSASAILQIFLPCLKGSGSPGSLRAKNHIVSTFVYRLCFDIISLCSFRHSNTRVFYCLHSKKHLSLSVITTCFQNASVLPWSEASPLIKRRLIGRQRKKPGWNLARMSLLTVLILSSLWKLPSLILPCFYAWTVRDLAGLRGTYRLIYKTTPAVLAIRKVLVQSCKTCHTE